jgi:hypothetical protein
MVLASSADGDIALKKLRASLHLNLLAGIVYKELVITYLLTLKNCYV